MLKSFVVKVEVRDRNTQIVIKRATSRYNARCGWMAEKRAIEDEKVLAKREYIRYLSEKYGINPSALGRMIEDGKVTIPETVDVTAMTAA